MLPAVASFDKVCRQILVYTVAVWGVSLAFGAVAHLDAIYWGAAMVLGAVFTALAVRLYRAQTEARAMRLFAYSITYVTLLFGAMAVDQLVLH